MKRIIAIIDTGFDDSSDAMRRLWEGFTYETIDLIGGGSYHPHGTMVANFAMRPFDSDQLRSSVHFIHIRAGNSAGEFPMGAIHDALDLLWEKNCTACNCSWGGPKPTTEQHLALAEKIFGICDGGVAFHWAAGNEDTNDLDEDMSRPQALLRQGDGTFLWGALNKDGTAPPWSSDGDKLWACLWAAQVPIHAPDGAIAITDGTSFASPKGCALCEAMLATGMAVDYLDLQSLMVDLAIHLTKSASGGYVPYLHPELGSSWHPKFGYGSLEHLYQGLTANARCRIPEGALPAVRWFNFRRV